jgi:DNA-binding MarR family transcriptional regulator
MYRTGNQRWSVDDASQALGVIERQTAVLMRHFEMLCRRTDVHDDLDRAEYLMLRTLDDCGPMDINGLATSLGVDPSTAGRQVAVLQNTGLVLKSPAPGDRRRSIITPTAEGLRRMETVRERRTESVADLLADWTEDELRTLGVLFDKYNRAVAAKHLTGAPERPADHPLAVRS